MAKHVHLWLRAESKLNERRTALTPNVCSSLLKSGFRITVEKSSQRIFDDSEYESINGLEMADEFTWFRNREKVPKDAFVIGLKELPENDMSPLSRTHIFFAHCYKNQAGWKEIMGRFINGGGRIWDLEFLHDERGKRVAAFGYHAGFTGAALGLDVWCFRNKNSEENINRKFPAVKPYENEKILIDHIKSQIKSVGRQPKVLVMGALGRCGSGACDFFELAGLSKQNILRWDMKETAKGGPFPELLDVDIFVNCIYLSNPIPPFLNMELLNSRPEGKLRLDVVVDVSCDTTNPYNPIPIYKVNTTFDDPVHEVQTKHKNLALISIDHLPTMLPRESSESFCNSLLPSVLELNNAELTRVWKEAERLFLEKSQQVMSDPAEK